MSDEEQLSPWIIQWQTAQPEWAVCKQTVQRVKNILYNWFIDHATVEERLEKREHKYSKTFDAAVEAKFPGVTERLNALEEEYLRLRSFDPAVKEDLMVKTMAETVAFQSLCDVNIRATAVKGNEVFGSKIFEVPDKVEDLSYDD